MNQPFVRAAGALLCIVIALLVVACAKDDVAPVVVEKQAFEDLRTEIREAIDDPAREAETIRLVGVLEEDLAAIRRSITARKGRQGAQCQLQYAASRIRSHSCEDRSRGARQPATSLENTPGGTGYSDR